jgi:hypothetical protein
MTGGCVFYRVPFHYTSDQHISPSGRFLEVRASPAQVGKLVADYVEQHKGRIDLSESNLPFRFAPAPTGEAAFAADRKVAEQEWKAYGDSSPRSWKKIDRSDPVLKELEIVRIEDPAANGSWVRATMLPRSRTLLHSSENMVAPNLVLTNSWTANEAIETRLYVWWWPASGGKTVIYARSAAFMPQYQVEAGAGASVTYQLWSATTGAVEASIVRELFASLASRARKSIE